MNKWEKHLMESGVNRVRDAILADLDRCALTPTPLPDINVVMKQLREDIKKMSNGFYNSHPCMQCGEMSCSDGEKLCARCRLTEARDILALHVPRTTQQDTIKGWKVGHIVNVAGKWRFRGMTQTALYGVVDEFQCCCSSAWNTGPAKHTKMFPGEQKDWRCGFYASKSPKGVLGADNFNFLLPRMHKQDVWLLEVELYGEVHKHKDGYKAEKQRVLSVRPYAQPNYPTAISNWWGSMGEVEGMVAFVKQYAAEAQKSLEYDDQYSLYQMFDAWFKQGHASNNYVKYMSRGWPGARLVYGVPGALDDEGRVIGVTYRSELTSKLGTSVREYDDKHGIEGPFPLPYKADYSDLKPMAMGTAIGCCPCPVCSSRAGYGFLDPGYPYNTGGLMGGPK